MWDLAEPGGVEPSIEGVRERERESEIGIGDRGREEEGRYVHSDTANDYIVAVH